MMDFGITVLHIYMSCRVFLPFKLHFRYLDFVKGQSQLHTNVKSLLPTLLGRDPAQAAADAEASGEARSHNNHPKSQDKIVSQKTSQQSTKMT